jgi:hypothetical protein
MKKPNEKISEKILELIKICDAEKYSFKDFPDNIFGWD